MHGLLLHGFVLLFQFRDVLAGQVRPHIDDLLGELGNVVLLRILVQSRALEARLCGLRMFDFADPLLFLLALRLFVQLVVDVGPALP